MNRTELRALCLHLAVEAGAAQHDAVTIAERYFTFIVSFDDLGPADTSNDGSGPE